MEFVHVPDDLKDIIRHTKDFILIPHKEPDGDCICSCLALDSFLRRLGKSTVLLNEGPFEKKEIRAYESQFKPTISKSDIEALDHPWVIILDCSTLDRIGELAKSIDGLPIILIDHHSSGLEFGNIRFINTTSPSTSLLILDLIDSLGHNPTAFEAEQLFFGFCTDTGFFRHLESKSALAFERVARLVEYGANPKKVFNELNGHASFEGRKHLGTQLSRAESYFDDKVLLVYETEAETKAVGKANRESDLVYQLLMGTENAVVVISLRADKDMVLGGLRSKHTVDVGELALKLGGGGHARASGFGVQASLDEVKKTLLGHLEALIKA